MNERMIDLVVMGGGGRMGRLVCARALEAGGFRLQAAVEHAESNQLGQPAVAGAAEPIITADFDGPFDVIIDFSTEAGTARALELAQRANAGILVASTGLSPETQSSLRAAAEHLPVLVAPNTSPGIAVMTPLVERAVQSVGQSWSVEIVESHHRQKRDAPSGTALHLADAVRRAGSDIAPEQIHSLRGGDVVGEHTIRLAGESEYLEIRHQAISRTLFADGALRAARWLAIQPAGFYSMHDVMSAS